MKGTAPRGRWNAEDRARAEALRTSEKNRAENVMIVDLCRNDLTRVCRGGTVSATSLFDVERYPTVWQMVSTVEGELEDDVELTDIFSALFPAGSITGAPKSSSMRLIAGLEHAPRGVYCGAIGYASPEGRATFNVGIRTMTVHRPTGRAEYGVGGGITWDSTAPDWKFGHRFR
jgi:para-aminobenzoate synthetase/4-amino-4-deoxychorismate lyase